MVGSQCEDIIIFSSVLFSNNLEPTCDVCIITMDVSRVWPGVALYKSVPRLGHPSERRLDMPLIITPSIKEQKMLNYFCYLVMTSNKGS